MAVLLRTGGDPAALAEPLRRAVARVDADLPLYAVSTLAENRAGALAAERFNGLLLTLLGALALLLAAVGVYGILAYYVGQRTREIGVRIALGASSGRVFALVLTESLAPVAAGVAVGLGLAAAGARLLESQLFGVTGTDPATFAAVAVLLSAVAAAAAALPARRALAIEPAKALRVG
jgi:ABC-type antimicrobial peptide transport system permease subunit